ncbi:MAG TPA: FtsW/RodA/SpoVE family cell cycle protein, partial [Anaerovoracaceae bacterium]|nr:FtsW/RodA/SpoVE family cell cycle protein [Anaerovoracaceae bacterium]
MNYFLSLFKNIDKILLALPICFAVISIIMIGSTAYDGAFIFNRDLKVQSAAYIIGFISILFILLMDYKIFQKYEKFIYISSILFLLTVYIPGLGVEHFGARSWINLGVTDLQPSELVKITFVLLFANYLSRNSENLFTYKGVFFA